MVLQNDKNMKTFRYQLTIYDTAEDWQCDTPSVTASFDTKEQATQYLSGYGEYYDYDLTKYQCEI